jgi:hypothetical protein
VSICQKRTSNSFALVGLGGFFVLGQIKTIAKKSVSQVKWYCKSSLILEKGWMKVGASTILFQIALEAKSD